MSFEWFMLRNQPEDAPGKTFEFSCSACGQTHSGSPSFAYAQPAHYFTIPEHERNARVCSDADTCVIDDEVFFIRTILEIPIIGADGPFTWGIWVSQSRESFERYLTTYHQDQSGDRSFGWLTVTIPGYVDSSGVSEWASLPCDVEWANTGQRPTLHLHDGDHQLIADQRNGISWQRAIELSRLTMHGA